MEETINLEAAPGMVKALKIVFNAYRFGTLEDMYVDQDNPFDSSTPPRDRKRAIDFVIDALEKATGTTGHPRCTFEAEDE